MKTKNILLFLLLLMLPSFLLNAEEPDKSKSQRENVEFTRSNFKNNLKALSYALDEIELGDNFFQQGNWYYVDAMFHYMHAYEVNPNNAMLNYKIGTSILMTYNKQDAQFYLEEAQALDPDVSFNLQYMLGLAYHINYDFENAILSYNSYLQKLKGRKYDQERNDVELRIKQARSGIVLMNDEIDCNVKNAGFQVNSIYPDYCPVISSDGNTMFYTSRRPGTTGGERDVNDFKYNEDIYWAEKVNGNWEFRDRSGIDFNSETHDATVGLSSDGQMLLVYRGTNGGDLFYSLKGVDSKWSQLIPLESLNTKYKESSACISSDGKTIYFTSNRPGGYGGLDIYMAKMKLDGSWGKAINLGPTVNSLYDEEGVSLSEDNNVLYFSSNNTRSMGGYDVFRSDYDNGEWSRPVNMGYPLNTTDDDVFFTFTGNSELAYFSSERVDGAGSQDIYSLNLVPERTMIVMKGMVIDEFTKNPIDYADIRITDDQGNEIAEYNDLGLGTPMYSVNLEAGKLYYITARSDGYNEVREELKVENSELSPEEIYHTTVLNMMNPEEISIPYVFFDFDKFDLRSKSIEDLDFVTRVMNTYPETHLLITGNTDIVGSWEYNFELSKLRSETVYNYLIENGIDAGRMEFEYYSYDRPIATNSNDEGRQLNRRTELKLLMRQ
ncbi:MAG: OmpA family protein [Bacteroidales bacterium]|nr:OmpA family protein [Bacteroidales bacterium]